MSEMPMFDDPIPANETPAPRKPKPKPTRRRKTRKAAKAVAPKIVLKPVKKRRKRRAKTVLRAPKDFKPNVTHAEFMAAWNVVAALAKFDNAAKKRILAKAAEAWT